MKIVIIKRKISFLFSACVLIVSMASCGVVENGAETTTLKNVYENCAITGLSTFTDITGVECFSVEERTSKTIYTYHLKDKADQLINKYVTYLTVDLGMDISNESGDMLYQNEEGAILTTSSNEAGYVVYKINIPIEGAALETRLDENYSNILELISDGNYKDAYEILQSDDEIKKYKNAASLKLYCEGMACYEYREYGNSIEYFDRAGDILDAKAKAQEVRAIVSKYDGTYYSDDPKYPGMGIGHYLFVHDGKASLELESTYEKNEAIYYHYNIMAKDRIGASGTMLMLGYPKYGMSEPDEDSYEYSFELMSDGQIMVIAYETNEYTTFNGFYTKKSSSYPNEK